MVVVGRVEYLRLLMSSQRSVCTKERPVIAEEDQSLAEACQHAWCNALPVDREARDVPLYLCFIPQPRFLRADCIRMPKWKFWENKPKDDSSSNDSSSNRNVDNALSSAMDSLRIDPQYPVAGRYADGSDFIGSLKPPGQLNTRYQANAPPIAFPQPQYPHGPLPVPPKIRMPEPSRTMQYAEAVYQL